METERLLIDRFQPDDWRDLHEYLSQDETVKYEPYDIFTVEESKQEAVRRSQSELFWAVFIKETGKLIGNVYLSPCDYDAWELGFVFNKHYQHMGYATEAVRKLLNHIFINKNARRVIAMCNPQNNASWKLLERVGFRREGHLLQNIYFKSDCNDQPIWVDTYEYGMLRNEWTKD